jgi:hypothetical protein
MISYGAPLSAQRAPARRPALLVAVRTAGIVGVVLALGSAAVPTAGAATVPSAGDGVTPTAAAVPAQSAHVAARSAAWAVQPTPNPLVREGNMAAVSCTPPTACVAVGSRINRAGARVTLAEAWNGRVWSVLKTPNPPGADQSELLGVSCTSATFCLAVGDSFTPGHDVPLAEAWNGTSWSIQQVPSPPGGGAFRGVSCASASTCVAVGGFSGTAFAGEWNGTSWSVQQVPSPPDAFQAELAGVSCTSASACMAVGKYYNGTSYQPTLAEAWNGTSWSVQATPTLEFGGSLNGVSCTSASSCTAVGDDGNGALAERWNGTAWSVQATPNVGGRPTVLGGVSCTSATLCTATGRYVTVSGTSAPAAERWNGTKWSVQRVPAPRTNSGAGLNGVSCTSASACIAVGSDGAALAEAWHGTSWSIQRITTPPGTISSELTSVSCTSASACMAAGKYSADADSNSAPLAEEWNGTSWSILPRPADPGAPASFGGGTFLTGASCTSPTACTAVGYYINSSGEFSTLAEEWNGTSWSIQPTPDQPGAVESFLQGVSCTSATACTAVGYYRNPSTYPLGFTLAEAWNGTSWSIQPTPHHNTSVNHVLNAVSCTSASACTAVGSQGFKTLAEAWNGATWSLQPTPHPEQGLHVLQGVSCTSASACTAVGTAYDGTLAESWNGTSWSIEPTPGPQTTVPAEQAGVSCPTATACTAVWSTGHRTIAAGWNGTAWALQRTASPAGSPVHLLGSVSCAPAGGCTAVGDYQTSTGAVLTLAEARP